jgi:drug/metabolite transporter (DMT)-like permease
MPLTRLPVFILLSASIIWGTTWWPLKTLAELGVSGLPQILVAYGSMALLTLPVLFVQFSRWRSEARYILLIFVIGGLANLAFAWSLIQGDVVRVMVLFYLLPVWGVLGGKIFLGERIDAQRALAVVLALAGAFLILGGTAVLAAPPSWVDLVAILSGFFFAMNNLCFRAAQIAPVPSKVAAMFLGCGVFAALLILAGVQDMPSGVSGSTWCLVIATGALLLTATAGSQYGVTHLEAGRASVLIILELVTAVITAAWWAGETMAPLEWLGGALILCAALLEAWRPPKP